MCRIPLLVTFDLELWPQGQISDFTMTKCVNFSHFHLLLLNHLIDWYYLIHKYNIKSSREKLGDIGKKINYLSWTLYFSNKSIISKSVFLLRLTSVCPYKFFSTSYLWRGPQRWIPFRWYLVWLLIDLTSTEQYFSAWVSDYCLMSNEQFSSYIMTRISYITMRWCWCPLGTRSTRLVEFCSASSLKQEYASRHAAPLGHNILIPSQPFFCSFS